MRAATAIKESLKPHPYLRKAREAAGFSQEELAALSGVSRGTIGQIERIDYRCRPDFQERIAQVLGKAVSDLWPPHLYPPPAEPMTTHESPTEMCAS